MLKLEMWEVDCFNELMQQKAEYEKLHAQTEAKLKDEQKELFKTQEGKGSSISGFLKRKSKEQTLTELQQKIEQVLFLATI
jgi:hypothetical protein